MRHSFHPQYGMYTAFASTVRCSRSSEVSGAATASLLPEWALTTAARHTASLDGRKVVNIIGRREGAVLRQRSPVSIGGGIGTTNDAALGCGRNRP